MENGNSIGKIRMEAVSSSRLFPIVASNAIPGMVVVRLSASSGFFPLAPCIPVAPVSPFRPCAFTPVSSLSPRRHFIKTDGPGGTLIQENYGEDTHERCLYHAAAGIVSHAEQIAGSRIPGRHGAIVGNMTNGNYVLHVTDTRSGKGTFKQATIF